MSERAYKLGSLPKKDGQRLTRLRTRLGAQSYVEVIRRLTIFAEVLLDHQKQQDAEIVLCRKGHPDRVVWII